MKETQTIEIWTIKSSFICLILFHMQMYMNFVNMIRKAMSKQYIIRPFCTISWIWIMVIGISLFAVHTLAVLSPHTMIPQTPPCNVLKINFWLMTISSSWPDWMLHLNIVKTYSKKSNQTSSNFTTVLVRIFMNKSLPCYAEFFPLSRWIIRICPIINLLKNLLNNSPLHITRQEVDWLQSCSSQQPHFFHSSQMRTWSLQPSPQCCRWSLSKSSTLLSHKDWYNDFQCPSQWQNQQPLILLLSF